MASLEVPEEEVPAEGEEGDEGADTPVVPSAEGEDTPNPDDLTLEERLKLGIE